MNFKKITTAVCLCCAIVTGMAQNKSKLSIPKDREIEKKVEKKISTMSLDDKIGQMIQLEIDMVLFADPNYSVQTLMKLREHDLAATIKQFGLENAYDSHAMAGNTQADYQFYLLSKAIANKQGYRLDVPKLDTAFAKYRVGSFLNAFGSIAADTQLWNTAINQIQRQSIKILGVPCLYGLDQVHGTTYTKGGTLFPHHIGMVATFNRDLAKRMGEICAYETRACGVPWIFGPNLDLGRKASWSRQYEGIGEDSYLGGMMGAAYLHGLQGNDPNHVDQYHVGTCLKHYFAYGVPDNGIDRTPANVTEQDLREKYFAPFMNAFRNGALSVMTNSSLVNGLNGVANHEFLTNWLKRDLNWDGMIITDWGDIENLRVRDHIAASKEDAIKMAVNAGVDMIMVPSEYGYGALLKKLVNDNEVSIGRINDAVKRVLRLKHRLGLFENPYSESKEYPLFGSKEHRVVSKQMALESEVLLKNENNTLPLKQGSKILVCGPNANSMRCLNGGWSYSWQGNKVETFTTSYNTILKALQNKFGNESIVYEPGVTYDETGDWQKENTPEIGKALHAAANAEYIIVCVGENSYAETTGNINDLNLSKNQKELVLAMEATGKPVIMVLNEGRPRLINELVQGAKSIIDIMLPGNDGGDALADLIAGDANFSGRLPFTYQSYPNSMTTYDFKVCESRGTMSGTYNYEAHTNVQWWFGDGLSYTKFTYSDFKVNKHNFTADDELTFTVNVKNVGDRTGKEAVLLFSSDVFASLIPDNRRLRGFEKIELQPGEMKTVNFTMKGSDLAFVGSDGKWVLEKGDFTMRVGKQHLQIACTRDHTWDSPNIH